MSMVESILNTVDVGYRKSLIISNYILLGESILLSNWITIEYVTSTSLRFKSNLPNTAWDHVLLHLCFAVLVLC